MYHQVNKRLRKGSLVVFDKGAVLTEFTLMMMASESVSSPSVTSNITTIGTSLALDGVQMKAPVELSMLAPEGRSVAE
nr:hypothetical protein [Methanococcoides vulcani]